MELNYLKLSRQTGRLAQTTCSQLTNRTACRSPKRSRLLHMKVNNALPPNYGYVLGSCAATAAVAQWMSIKVSIARRESGVKYPKMYADGDDEAAMKFNCTQRAHQNTVESLPSAFALQILLGNVFPMTAAALGMTWNVGRIIYMQGYSTGDPNKRAPGFAISSLSLLGMMGTAVYAAVKLLKP